MIARPQGKRHYVVLIILVGDAPRRQEFASLDIATILMRGKKLGAGGSSRDTGFLEQGIETLRPQVVANSLGVP